MRQEEAAAVASLLAVSIFGFNKDRKFIVPGTAIRIAPRLALTARHVTSYVFQQLGLRENELWPRQQQKTFEGMEVRVAEQNLGGQADDSTTPWWFVEGSFPSKITDISILLITPGNEAARTAELRGRFFRWSLEPPREQQRLWAYGYLEDENKRHVTYDDAKMNFLVSYDASTAPVRVERVFEKGKREQPRDVPALFHDPAAIDTGGMPCFEVEGNLEPSMSGGPVFNGDQLFGIVSTGMTYQPEEGISLKPYGTVALLSPLLDMKKFRLNDTSEWISIADEIAAARIQTV
jgi:hypothetical protein